MATDNFSRIAKALNTINIKLQYDEVKQNVEGYYLQFSYSLPSDNVQEKEVYSIYIIKKPLKPNRGQIEIKQEGDKIIDCLNKNLELSSKITPRYLGTNNDFHIHLLDFELQRTI